MFILFVALISISITIALVACVAYLFQLDDQKHNDDNMDVLRLMANDRFKYEPTVLESDMRLLNMMAKKTAPAESGESMEKK